jgi:hypothetical protein
MSSLTNRFRPRMSIPCKIFTPRSRSPLHEYQDAACRGSCLAQAACNAGTPCHHVSPVTKCASRDTVVHVSQTKPPPRHGKQIVCAPPTGLAKSKRSTAASRFHLDSVQVLRHERLCIFGACMSLNTSSKPNPRRRRCALPALPRCSRLGCQTRAPNIEHRDSAT